jgi:hypothetical protein
MNNNENEDNKIEIFAFHSVNFFNFSTNIANENQNDV